MADILLTPSPNPKRPVAPKPLSFFLPPSEISCFIIPEEKNNDTESKFAESRKAIILEVENLIGAPIDEIMANSNKPNRNANESREDHFIRTITENAPKGYITPELSETLRNSWSSSVQNKQHNGHYRT